MEDRFWRIDASVASIDMFTSPDGVKWVLRDSFSLQLPLSTVRVELGSRSAGRALVSASFDDYNGGGP